jgi:hypothetical protein
MPYRAVLQRFAAGVTLIGRVGKADPNLRAKAPRGFGRSSPD